MFITEANISLISLRKKSLDGKNAISIAKHEKTRPIKDKHDN